MLRKASLCLALAVAGLTSLIVVGCNYTPDQPPVGAANPVEAAGAAQPQAEHGHKPGTHGGLMVEIGRDNYHAEAVFERKGVVRVYLLGKDEARVQETEVQTLTAFAKVASGTESSEFQLRPTRQPDDADGKTSLFTGTLPAELWGQRVDVTVPSIRIGGERFRFGFSNALAEVHAQEMPAKVDADEERQLYLTPGGKYTDADIKANGSRTASAKFGGKMARHDKSPKPGDKICPITDTLANPQFTWVVGGKVYEFCCPPCVDEFVKMAKESPEEVQEPGDYVKK